jgi:hypothetical protein
MTCSPTSPSASTAAPTANSSFESAALAAKPAVLASLQSTKQCPTLRRMCGNSVCLPLTEALIGANFAHEEQLYGRTAA